MKRRNPIRRVCGQRAIHETAVPIPTTVPSHLRAQSRLGQPFVLAFICAYALNVASQVVFRNTQSKPLTASTLSIALGLSMLALCATNGSDNSTVLPRLSYDQFRLALLAGTAILFIREGGLKTLLWAGTPTATTGIALIVMDFRTELIGIRLFTGAGLGLFGTIPLIGAPFRHSYLNVPEGVYPPPMIRRPTLRPPHRAAPTAYGGSHRSRPAVAAGCADRARQTASGRPQPVHRPGFSCLRLRTQPRHIQPGRRRHEFRAAE